MSYLNLISATPSPQLASRDDSAVESDDRSFETALSGAIDREREETTVKDPEPTAVASEDQEEDSELTTDVESAADDAPVRDDSSEDVLPSVPVTDINPEALAAEPSTKPKPIQSLTALVKPVREGTVEPVADDVKIDGRPVLPQASVALSRPGLAGGIPIGTTKPGSRKVDSTSAAHIPKPAAPETSMAELAPTLARETASVPTTPESFPGEAQSQAGDFSNRTSAAPVIAAAAQVAMEADEDKATQKPQAAAPKPPPATRSAEFTRPTQAAAGEAEPLTDPAGDRPAATEAPDEVQPREALPKTQAAPHTPPAPDRTMGESAQVRATVGVEETSGPRIGENGPVAKSQVSQRPTPPAELPRQTLRIIQEMKSSGQNSYRAEIRLDPPELGRIRIELNMEGERTWARLVVENAAAREQVQSELPRIKELLESQGLGEARVEVQLRKENASEQQSGRDGGREMNENDLTVDDDLDSAGIIRRSEHDGLIDLRA